MYILILTYGLSFQNTVTGLSKRAEKFLSYAVDLWPTLQKPFQKDPITEVSKSGQLRLGTFSDGLVWWMVGMVGGIGNKCVAIV